jgi:hypothetical protein
MELTEMRNEPTRLVRGYAALYPYIPRGKTYLKKLIERGVLHAPIMLGPRSPCWRLEWVREAQERLEAEAAGE